MLYLMDHSPTLGMKDWHPEIKDGRYYELSWHGEITKVYGPITSFIERARMRYLRWKHG